MNGNWQPIETAPKDGTTILVFPAWDTPPRSGECRWREGSRKQWWYNLGYWIPHKPTHWMPMPLFTPNIETDASSLRDSVRPLVGTDFEKKGN